MAFEGLADKLQKTFKNLRGKGVVTEKDIDAAMRDVKLALLEADGIPCPGGRVDLARYRWIPEADTANSAYDLEQFIHLKGCLGDE